MKQDADSEEDFDSSDLIKLASSFSQISSESSTHSISVSEGSKSFPGGLITVRRTVYQVEEEIAIMEVHPVKPAKTAVQKAGKFGGRLFKTLFDASPAEVVSAEHKHHSKDKEREQKEAALKSSSNKSSSSSGSGGKPYIIASASPPPHPVRKPTDSKEFGGYEEPLCTPSLAPRKNHRRQDTHDSFITPGIRAYPKPREITVLEHSKYSDSPGRSSRTTSTETSSHSNTFESDFDLSTDSTGDRTSRREKERSHQALIDRLHAEALKMKLEKAEDEMLKLRMEVHSPAHPQKPTDQQLEAYRQDSNSNQQSSVDRGDRNGISRINSLEDSTNRRQQEQYGSSYESAGRPEIAPLRSTLFVADGEDGIKAQQQDDSDREIPPGNWVDYQPELEIVDDSDPMQVDNAWRSAQMYTFLQDAAAVNTVSASTSILNQERSEKKLTVAVHKRDSQQPKPHSRCQSKAQSPTHLHDQQEQLQQQQQRFAQMQQDPRDVLSRPHSRNEDSSTTAAVHQHQVHSVERSRSVETMSSSTTSSSSTTQQQRHVMQRTQSVDSNSSSKSGHSPKSGGQSYVSSTRTKSNTTIAERISRTHNMMNVQQSVSPPTEIHRHPQLLQAVSNFQAEPAAAVSDSGFQAERVGYRRPQLQPMSHQLEFETYRQPQPQQQQHSGSDYNRQPQSMPQPELFPRQPHQSIPQPEPYNRQQQSHGMFQQQQQYAQQLELDIRRQPQQQYREQQQQSSLLLQSFDQQRLSQTAPGQQQQQPDHQRSGSLTFPSLPQLNLGLMPLNENVDEGVSSPLQLSPTSSGLITPTSMAPPTVFQSDEERAAWQHQRTMERMQNARRNREALLLKQRGATPAR